MEAELLHVIDWRDINITKLRYPPFFKDIFSVGAQSPTENSP